MTEWAEANFETKDLEILWEKSSSEPSSPQ